MRSRWYHVLRFRYSGRVIYGMECGPWVGEGALALNGCKMPNEVHRNGPRSHTCLSQRTPVLRLICSLRRSEGPRERETEIMMTKSYNTNGSTMKVSSLKDVGRVNPGPKQG